MSTVDERVVILEFNNAQFETNVKQSVSTLQKLKESLNLDGSAKSLDALNKSARSFNMTQVADNVQTVADRFSALGIVGDQVLRRLTDGAINLGRRLLTAIPNQIISGGKKRAQNIEQAKFMLEGLLGDQFDWDTIKKDIDYAVGGTAYGFDEAASAAGQLAASSVQFGEDMKAALRGISGVATMTNDEYGTIAQIFTKIAGQGKVMTQELNQLAAHGLNVAATMAKYLDETSLHAGATEADVREMVHDGVIDFQTFANAMDYAFGEHAKNANATFSGVLRNIKASLSRMGEQFATPIFDNLRIVLTSLLPVMKDLEAFLKNISGPFSDLASTISGSVAPALERLHYWFAGIRGLQQDYDFSDLVTTWANKLNGMTREEAQELGLFDKLLGDFEKREQEIKDKLTDINTGATFYDSTLLTNDKNAYLGVLEEVVDATEENGKMMFDPIIRGVESTSSLTKKFGKISSKSFKEASKSVKGLRGEINGTYGIFKSFDPIVSSYKKQSADIQDNLAKTLTNVKEGFTESRKAQTLTSKLQDKTQKAFKLKSIVEFGKLTKDTYGSLNQSAKKYVKEGKKQEQVDYAKNMAAEQLNEAQQSTITNIQNLGKEEQKESLWQKSRNKAYTAASNIVNGIAKGAAKIFGFDEKSTKLLDKNSEEYKKFIDEYAETVIHGDYGNGEERIKKLNGLANGLWATVQNVVNEKMGSGVRHAVTDEEDVEVLQFVAEQLGINTEQAKVCQSVFDNLTNALAGFLSVLYFIRDVAVALFTEVIQPFLAFAIPRVLNAILTPLGFIGDKLGKLYSSIQEGSITQFFANFADKVRNFWASVKELDGVKALNKAWSNFKKTMAELVDKVINKVTKGFSDLQKTFNLPDASFFLGILDSIGNALSFLVDVLSNAASHLGTFFEPLFNWVTTIPSKIQEFWTSLWGGGEGEEASDGLFSIGAAFETLKNNVDAFIESVAPLKAAKDWIKGIWDSFFGTKEEDPNKKGIPKKIQQEIKDRYNIIDAVDAIKKKVSGVVDAIAPLRAVKDWMKDFWNTIFGTPGEGEDPESYGFGAAFEKLKQQINDFIDGIPILKTIKDWFGSIFNEGLSNSITDIGKAISDFFKALFDKQEEGEGTPLPFGERFIQAAERLKEKIVQIFGASPELGKLLMTGGGLAAGILGIIKLISSIKENQNGVGIAGAIFGNVKGGMSIPKIIAAVLGIAAALNIFGININKTGEESEEGLNIFQKVLNFFGDFFEKIKKSFGDNNVPSLIHDFLFGKKGESGEKVKNGVFDTFEEIAKNAGKVIETAFGALFGGKDGKFGFKNATFLFGITAGLLSIIGVIRVLMSVFSAAKNIFSGTVGMLSDVHLAMDAYTRNTNANTFLSIAKSIALFAGSLFLLSIIPTDKLYAVASVVVVLGALAGGLLIAFSIIEKIGTGGIAAGVAGANKVVLTFVNSLAKAFRTAATMAGIGLMFTSIALAIGILTSAIVKLSNQKDLSQGMRAVGEIFAGMALLVGMIAVASKSGAMMKGAGQLTLIALSLILLAGAVAVFNLLDWSGIRENTANLLVMLALFASLGAVASKLEVGKGVGAMFLSLSVGLIAFGVACNVLSLANLQGVVVGLIGMVVALVGLTNIAKAGGITGGGGALAGLALTLLALAAASLILGYNLPQAIYGLALLGAALLGFIKIISKLPSKDFYKFSTISKNLFSLAAGVLMLGIALPILGQGLIMLGDMVTLQTVWDLIKGFGVMSVVLLTVAGISKIATPAVAKLGLAFLALGAGIALIVGSFTGFKGLKAVLGELGGGIGAILSGIGGVFNGFSELTSKSASELDKSANNYQRAATKYGTAIKEIDGLSDQAKQSLASQMMSLRQLDGSDFQTGLENVFAEIISYNLDGSEAKKLLYQTAVAAMNQAKEEYSIAINNLKTRVNSVAWAPGEEEHFWNLVEDLVNSGYTPGDDDFAVGLDALSAAIKTSLTKKGIGEDIINTVILQAQAAAIASAGAELALRNLNITLSDPNVIKDEEQRSIINGAIQTYLNNETFNGKATVDKISAIIDSSGVKLNTKQRAMLWFSIQNAIQAARDYNYALTDLKVGVIAAADGKEDVANDIYNDILLPAITRAGELLAAGDEEGANKIIFEELPVSLQGKVDQEQVDELLAGVQKAANKKKTQLIALNNLLVYGEKYSISPSIMTKIGQAIDEYSGDPNNVAELSKIWIACKEAGVDPENIDLIFNQIGAELDAGMKEAIALHNLQVTYEENGIEIEDQEMINDTIRKIQEGELDEHSIEYQAALNILIRKDPDAETDLEGARERAQTVLDDAINKGGTVQIAHLEKIGITITTAEFATDAERAKWLGKVRDLLTIKQTDPFSLPVAIQEFLLDLSKSTMDATSKKLIEAEAKEILNTYETAYMAEFGQVQKRMQIARRAALGGAGAVDVTKGTETSGLYVLKNTKLMDAITEYWGNVKEVNEDSWKEFSDYLTYDLHISEADFIEALGGLENIPEWIVKLMPGGDVFGTEAIVLQELFSGLIESIRAGASEQFKSEQRRDEFNFVDLLIGDGVTEEAYRTAENVSDDLVNEFTRIGLIDKLKNELGKEEITSADVLSWLYDPTTGESKIDTLVDMGLVPEYMGNLKILIENIQSAADEAKAEAERSGKEFSYYDWLADILRPEQTEALEKAAKDTETAYEGIYKTLEEGNQQNFIEGMMERFNPEGVTSDIDYANWFDQILQSIGLVDENGDLITLESIFSKFDAEGSDFDIWQWLANMFHSAFQNGTASVSMGDFASQYPELIGLGGKFASAIFGQEGGWLTLRGGEAEKLQESMTEEFKAYYELMNNSAKEAVEASKNGDDSGLQAVVDSWVNGNLSSEQAMNMLSQFSGEAGSESSNALFNAFKNGASAEDMYGLLKPKGEDAGNGLYDGLMSKFDSVGDLFFNLTDNGVKKSAEGLASNSPSKKMKALGIWAVIGLRQGINETKKTAIEAFKKMAEQCVEAANSFVSKYFTVGSDSAINYGTGVVSHPQYVNLAGATVVRQAIDGVKTEMDGSNGPEEAGKNFTRGFARGISNEEAVAEVTAAANNVANTANSGITIPEKIESPSKVTMGYGRYFTMGFAIGIEQFSKKVEDASRSVAETSITALGNPLAAVQNVLDSDLDYDPTIRPVMDISGIQNGVKTINGMMPNTKVGLDFISNSMNRVKTTNEDVVSAITGLSKQMEGVKGGDSYTVNGVTYDDGSNISTAVKSLIHAAKVERRA